MNRDEYKALLETQNGYCGCLEIAELLAQRRATKDLEKTCDILGAKSSANVDNGEDDCGFVEFYADAAVEFRDAAEDYYDHLGQKVADRQLTLRIHRKKNRSYRPVGDIPTIKPSEIKDDDVITAHCSKCDQQIDVIEHLEFD